MRDYGSTGPRMNRSHPGDGSVVLQRTYRNDLPKYVIDAMGYNRMKLDGLVAPDLEMMDEIWHGEFAKVFSPFLPHIWYLSPTPASPSPRWKRFKDSAKVRFCCQTCGHGWTSMKGRVVFWYFLNYPYYEGFVQFKLYGQQCQRCNNGMYETAMWYPEEVNKVLCNLYNRIGQAYYGFVKPPMRYDRRAGKPRTQHNAALCQACQDGECDSRPRTTTNPGGGGGGGNSGGGGGGGGNAGGVTVGGGGTSTPQPQPPPPPPPPPTAVIQTTPPPKTTLPLIIVPTH